jgi:hypothetical protein
VGRRGGASRDEAGEDAGDVVRVGRWGAYPMLC